MNKISITIAIPALNEEANIKKLIDKLLEQENTWYDLVDFVIVSDGSDDSTVEIVKLIGGVVRVVSYNERKGKSARLNDIFHEIVNWDKSEVVVLFDADTLPVDQNVIDNLIKHLVNNSKIKLTSGKPISLRGKTLFEKVLKVSAFLQDEIKMFFSESVFTCHGRSLAIHRDLAKKTIIPGYMVGNDAYIYFVNKINNFKYKYIQDANVYYRMPNSFNDFKKQFIRFRNSQELLKKELGDKINIEREYKISKKIKRKIVINSFLKFPLLAPIYYMAYILAKIQANNNTNQSNKNSGAWEVSNSTKKL